MPIDDETDTESSYGPGPHPLYCNLQPFLNNGLLFQTDFQSLLQPSVTPQQNDLGAYTLDTGDQVFDTEQLGCTANMHFFQGFDKD